MVTIEPIAEAALQRDGLQLRHLTQALLRACADLSVVPRPRTSDPRVLAVAAALLELLAGRRNQPAPAWTSEIGTLEEPIFLLEAAARMPRLRRLCETEAPEPLRTRGIYAPPNFLEFA